MPVQVEGGADRRVAHHPRKRLQPATTTKPLGCERVPSRVRVPIPDVGCFEAACPPVVEARIVDLLHPDDVMTPGREYQRWSFGSSMFIVRNPSRLAAQRDPNGTRRSLPPL